MKNKSRLLLITICIFLSILGIVLLRECYLKRGLSGGHHRSELIKNMKVRPDIKHGLDDYTAIIEHNQQSKEYKPYIITNSTKP